MVMRDKRNIDAAVPEDSSIFITCFTDASFCPKTKAFGYAYWIKCLKGTTTFSDGGIGISGSQEAEKLAIKTLVKHLLRDRPFLQGKVIIIQSDCLHALEGNSCIADLRQAGAKYVKLKHVKAHTSQKTNRTKVNNTVDELAKKQMKKFREQVQETNNAN